MSRLVTPLLAFSLTAALSACADSGDEAIQILSNVVPGPMCSIDPNTTNFKPFGTIDVGSDTPYLFNAKLHSRIVAAVGEEAQKTVLLQGARIDITFADAGTTGALFSTAELADLEARGLTKFETLFSAPLKPGGDSTGSYPLVPPALLAAIKAKLDPAVAARVQLITTAVVHGNYAGSDVDSSPFKYPVTVCNDCVYNVVGACNALPMGGAFRLGDPCNPSQDGPIDCCTTETGGLVCPAVAAPTT